MKSYIQLLILFSILYSPSILANIPSDTLNGYLHKIHGEEIQYFSPKHEFAKQAMLTRCNGISPIEWNAPTNQSQQKLTTYQLLIGHSNGTSSANRLFDLYLNNQFLFTIETPLHKKGMYRIEAKNKVASFLFLKQELDANEDAFGVAYLTVPTSMINKKAHIKVIGRNQASRDWLMVFQYEEKLDAIITVQSLIKRQDSKRAMNIIIDNPFADSTVAQISSSRFNSKIKLKKGYNQFSISSYEKNYVGNDTVSISINQQLLKRRVDVYPIRDLHFYIIHHSHNDIGYSHLQTEVEQIQNNNIRSALSWIHNNSTRHVKPIWHIESLWALENFFRTANAQEKKDFQYAVQQGHIILSANYINILTGLCSEEELNWLTEYASSLVPELGPIYSSMITDIPGISASGLRSQLHSGVQYLSLGPNYVESLPDKGDRVGGIIKLQGDQPFYWKNNLSDSAKLLVWTAGKGYSFFHGISDEQKQAQWEKRISSYCNELYQTNYPYDIVQLRYTKRSDNGPVDTALCSFIDSWNVQFESPTLHLSSVPETFKRLEEQYGKQLPIRTGELSPYWEDGAYSTAAEEIANRALSQKTIALEKFLRTKKLDALYKNELYALHRNILLFHEHTWGAWCSISDPTSSFTQEQWKYKKAFLDSGLAVYQRIATETHFEFTPTHKLQPITQNKITDFNVDTHHGGLRVILSGGRNIVAEHTNYSFFEPVYISGLNTTTVHTPSDVKIIEQISNDSLKKIRVLIQLTHFNTFELGYLLNKQTGLLTCTVKLDKQRVDEKESLHLAMPFHAPGASLRYQSGDEWIRLSKDQLPGSNFDFISTEGILQLQSHELQATLFSPSINLVEVGSILDENNERGAKEWKSKLGDPSQLFLYVLNNYWHTNYKAYQEGSLEFSVQLQIE